MAVVSDRLSAWCQTWYQDAALSALAPLAEADLLALRGAMAGEMPAGARVMVAQLNPACGNPAVNARQAAAAMAAAEGLGVDLLVFPELFLMGYPLRDLIVRFPHLVQEQLGWLDELAKRSGHCRVLLGVAEPNPDLADIHRSAPWRASPRPFFNSVAILGDGQLLGVARKAALATYQQYDDHRVFEPSKYLGVLPANQFGRGERNLPMSGSPGLLTLPSGDRVGLLICEESWRVPDWPVSAYAGAYRNGEVSVYVNLCASVSRGGKLAVRRRLLAEVTRRLNAPVLYVNQVGAIDECSFDGDSQGWWVDAAGHVQETWRAPCFQPGLFVVPLTQHPVAPTAAHAPSQPPAMAGAALTAVPAAAKHFNPDDADELARTFESIRQTIRDYFRKTGFRRALLGVSGGLDSAVTGALLAAALGPEQVLMVSMPSHITPDDNRTDAQQLAERLGCPFTEIPMGDLAGATLQAAREVVAHPHTERWGWEREPHPHSTAAENVQAIQRATLLRLLANDFNALPIATCDKSEFYMGYATVNGDMSGALAPIADLVKTRVRALARWMNQAGVLGAHPEAIPASIIERPSGADLALNPDTGDTVKAEEALMPYLFADEVIWRIETQGQSPAAMLGERFVYEDQHGPLAPDTKRQWLEKFYKRLETGVFKWWLAPPMVLLDQVTSLGKSTYHHPLVAQGLPWWPSSPGARSEALSAAAGPPVTGHS
jgi:NAD+ synthase (glutamine-hydrolysing)